VLNRAIELAGARAEAAELEREGAEFPAWMDALVGDEPERLDKIRARAEAAKAALLEAEAAHGKARRQLADTGLPPGGLPYERLSTLNDRLATLCEADRTAREA